MELNFINLKITLTDKELKIIGSIDNSELNTSQLHNLSTYLNLLSRFPNAKNIEYFTHDTELTNDIFSNIVHACNYDSDEINNYWIILDRNFNFLDVGIPQIANLDDDKLYTHLSEQDKKIVKLIKNLLV